MTVYFNEMTGELVSDTTLREQFDDGELDTEHEGFDEYLAEATSWRHGTLEEMSEDDLEGRFSDLLDEVHVPYEMAGMTFYPSAVLKSDPIAYRQEFMNWLDSEGVSTDDI